MHDSAEKSPDTTSNPGDQIPSGTNIYEEWVKPMPEETPPPTFWPISLAMSIIFILWGIISTWVISVVGLILFSISIRGWVKDLLNEQQPDQGKEDEAV
jgi:hypothetical protein